MSLLIEQIAARLLHPGVILLMPASNGSDSNTTSASIQQATRQNQWLFFGYMFVLLLGACFTYLLWRSGNNVQDAVTNDAKARIGESDAKAESAKKDAAQANERSRKLESDNLVLRQTVANLEIQAEESKKSTALLQEASAKQQERAAVAERELLTLRSKVQDRTITPEQRKRFLEATRGMPKGLVIVSISELNAETIAYGTEVAQLISDAGWSVRTTRFLLSRGLGIGARIDSVVPLEQQALPDGSIRTRIPADSKVLYAVELMTALRSIGLTVDVTFRSGKAVESDAVEISVLPKPTSVPN